MDEENAFQLSQFQNERVDYIHDSDWDGSIPEVDLNGWTVTTSAQIFGNQMVWGAKRPYETIALVEQ